eukprot:s4280_g2.t1
MSYWSGGWQSYEYGSSYGNWDSWRYQPHGGAWSAYDWHRESDMAREEEMPELLPDYVQGWYLLQDAGLTMQEKNVVQTALQGDFSLQRVAQELRNQWNQWSGNELLRREPAGRQGGYLGEYLAEDDDDEGEDGEPPDVNFEELSPEGQELWEAAEGEVQGAMAAMHQARRTLRDARARQTNVRLSRQYYQKGSKGTGRHQKPCPPALLSTMTCLRCGKVGHRVANCPQPPTSQAASKPEATSSFICFSDTTLEPVDAYAMEVTTTADAVKLGKAVVDGGATRTLASIEAMEAIMQINERKHGETRLAELNMEERPVFGFGNGSENRCASTAQLQIQANSQPGRLRVHCLSENRCASTAQLQIQANSQPGRLRVHCLDHGDGPLLLSVDSTLRS